MFFFFGDFAFVDGLANKAAGPLFAFFFQGTDNLLSSELLRVEWDFSGRKILFEVPKSL